MAGMKTKPIEEVPHERYIKECVQACADLIQLMCEKEGLVSVEVEGRVRFTKERSFDTRAMNVAMPKRAGKMKAKKTKIKPLKAKA